MALLYATPINLNQLELQNPRFQNLAADPGTPVEGQFYWNTVSSRIKYYNGSTWVSIGHDTLPEFVANEHIDHSSVTLTAGIGLTGGGDITTSRTFDLDIPGLTDLTDAGVLASTDSFAVYNASAAAHQEATVAQLQTYMQNNLSFLTAVTNHASTHISAGSDEIDGDQLDIDWNPTNYTPATTPTEVTSVDHLTAHLYGIDQALGAAGSYTFQNGLTETAGTVELGGSVTTDRVLTLNSTSDIFFQKQTAFTTTAQYPLVLRHTTSSTAGVGFGVGIEFGLEDSAGSMNTAGYVQFEWLDATNASEDSVLSVFAYSNAISDEVLRLSGADMTLPNYSSAVTGTPVYFAAFDSSGKLITTDIGSTSALTTAGAFGSGDKIPIYDTSAGAIRMIDYDSLPGAAGGITSFTLAGDTGTAQSITDGNTVTIAGGTAIDTVASATDTVTISFDLTELTALGAVPDSADTFVIYDDSAATHKKVTYSNLIGGVTGGVTYQGTWNATTNSPTITSSVGTQGHYYVVSVAGTTNINGITDWQVGDWIIFNGTVWEKVDNTDQVTSVFGRTGVVTAQTSDYDANQIDYNNATSGLTATDVQAAIDELDSAIDTLNSSNFPSKYTTTVSIGDVPGAQVITHNLNTKDVLVSIRDTATDDHIVADVECTSVNTITVQGFGATISCSVTVIG